MSRRRHRKRHDDLESAALPDIIEYGGELIWVIGFTSGGAPYGLTEHNCAGEPELLELFEKWKAHNYDESQPGSAIDLDAEEPPF